MTFDDKFDEFNSCSCSTEGSLLNETLHSNTLINTSTLRHLERQSYAIRCNMLL